MSRLTEQKPPAVCHRLETSDTDWRAIEGDALVRMLLLLHLIREFETRVLELKDEDLVHGPVHASIGQEAVAAGAAAALLKSDMIASTHRAHGHLLAKALIYYAPEGYHPLREPFTPPMQQAVHKTLAEIMGLREGWCGGRGGSMHLCDVESGNLGSNAIVGGGIPIATGTAWAQKLHRDVPIPDVPIPDVPTRIVVSFFGDGAFNQGCFHEVANMAVLWKVPILYLVENNLYAVGTCTRDASCVEDLARRSIGYGFDSVIVDGMDPVSVYIAVREAARRMRREPFPFLIEAKTYRFYHHGGGLAGSAFGYRSGEEEAEWLARDPLVVFPARLMDLGLIGEGDDERLRAMAKDAVERATGLCTEERDGADGTIGRCIPAAKWPSAESVGQDVADETMRGDEDVFAGVEFKEQEDFAGAHAEPGFRAMTYVQAIASATLRNMERDERVIVLGEEVANLRGGAYSATRGIKEAFPDRLFNTPISEAGFVGMAGGLAAAGWRPVVEIMFPDFALMASDQLFNQIGRLRHMYGGQVRFPIVVRTRVAIGFGYGGQHSMDPSGFFALFSGWRIVAPSNAFDYVGLFNTAMRFEDPVLIVEHGMLYQEEGMVPANTLDYLVEYGKAKVVRQGTDVTVLTYLTGVQKCLQVADELSREGISAEVIDLRTLDYTGMDFATIGQSVKKTGSVLIVEQAPRSMALAPRISDEIQERFFDYLDCPVGKVAALDVPLPVSRMLEEAVLPSLQQIRTHVARGGRHRG
ncbi:MAG TPA: thiamine pyrophosphate-dependent enzyme [Anaerolineae bacterium]|nr:thiamine pyrophosphate-dependent enzyme [Anaerolineae bacterium]